MEFYFSKTKFTGDKRERSHQMITQGIWNTKRYE